MQLQMHSVQFIWVADAKDQDFWATTCKPAGNSQIGFGLHFGPKKWAIPWDARSHMGEFEGFGKLAGKEDDGFLGAIAHLIASGEVAAAAPSAISGVPVTHRYINIRLTKRIQRLIGEAEGAVVALS